MKNLSFFKQHNWFEKRAKKRITSMNLILKVMGAVCTAAYVVHQECQYAVESVQRK